MKLLNLPLITTGQFDWYELYSGAIKIGLLCLLDQSKCPLVLNWMLGSFIKPVPGGYWLSRHSLFLTKVHYARSLLMDTLFCAFW